MIHTILVAALVIGGMGLVFGIILGIASKIFRADKDERLGLILQVLPCANCGGCGYAGCSSYAQAIINGDAKSNECIVGGTKCSTKISSIMGSNDHFEKKVARVKCAGNCDVSPVKYDYVGIDNCSAALKIASGPKNCTYGCLGVGSCVKVCPQNAISINNGVAFVKESLCIGCGKCVNICPRKLIELIPAKNDYTVTCSSESKSSEVTKVCEIGCIGCRMCVKVCEYGAITIEDNLAKIDPEKCVNCGLCSEKCPRKIIKKF
ncbi:MAG: RnfABCDGE type electron transport complex subunit B [Bacillota bacterium]|nr:RnfABCDGE type electron transport complex subunit B [Bacillota bacterium]